MLLLPCPFCGARAETEFAFGGDGRAAPPPEGEAASDAAWTEALYFRDNPRGAHRELWFHRHGCRRWIVVERDTVSHVILRAELLAPPARKDGSA